MSRHVLPNPHLAVVDPAKVRQYLRSPIHPVGRHEVAVFEAAGYRWDDWQRLQTDLLRTAWMRTAAPIQTPLGREYRTDAMLLPPAGRRLAVRVIWLVRAGEDFPRLVTVFSRRRHAL
jgi:hypothetical protein